LLEIRRIGHRDVEEFSWLRDLWRGRVRMWQDRQVWLHGDATPGNFLFGTGMHVGAIDLERMRRGDRVFDVGRMVGELQHSFMVATGRKSRAEPFISYFFHEYSSHFPKPGAAFASITARAPFYMGLNHLRIARNDYVTESYGARLVRKARGYSAPVELRACDIMVCPARGRGQGGEAAVSSSQPPSPH
jgi:hypothetical protein